MLPLVLALALVVPSAAPPGRTLDPKAIAAKTASTDLAEGLRKYEEIEYQVALPMLERASKDPMLRSDEVAAAALYAGMIAASLADDAAARKYFQAAVKAIPDLELPSEAPPKVQAQFAEVQRDARLEAAPSVKPGASLERPAEDKPIYQAWWLWTGVGAVVVAAGVVAAVVVAGNATKCGGAGTGCIDLTTRAGFAWGP
ncbi:MAG: hypothetical protein QM765_23075 [Myxococcales bacterium]